jgi:hypothetical protein
MQGLSLHIIRFDTVTRMLLYVAVAIGIWTGVTAAEWWLVGAVTTSWLIYLGSRIFVMHHTACDLGERKYNISVALFDIIQPCWELVLRLCLWFTPKEMHMRRKV